MYLTERTLSSLQSMLIWLVFVSNTGDTVKGVFLGIPQRRSPPGRTLQQPQPRFQTKTTS